MLLVREGAVREREPLLAREGAVRVLLTRMLLVREDAVSEERWVELPGL